MAGTRAISCIAVLMVVAGVCFSVSSHPAAAAPVALSIAPSDISINNSEIKSVDVIVTNNQNFPDTFSLSVWPSTMWAGITPNLEKDKIVNLGAMSSGTAKLYFSVAPDAQPIATSFLVTAASTSVLTENVSASATANVVTQRKTYVYVSDVFIDNYALEPEGCMNIRIDVTNLGEKAESYKLSTTVTKDKAPVQRMDDYTLVISSKSVGSAAHSYCAGKYTPWGTYTLSATLKNTLNDLLDTQSKNFNIVEKSDLVYAKTVSYTPFAQTKVIIVTNEGNRMEKDFYVTETVSGIASKLFYPVTEPASAESADGKVTYRWRISQLTPGEQTTVTYEIRFVSIWISGLLIAIVVFVAFTYVYSPRISKGFVMAGPLKRGKEVPVLIEVRNSTLHEIRNIVVSDTIPALASLVEKFDTMKPDAKKTDSGTDLVWRIKSLKPLEERVLTYRLKTNVDVIGSLRLPRAGMEYLNHRHQVKMASSRAIELK